LGPQVFCYRPPLCGILLLARTVGNGKADEMSALLTRFRQFGRVAPDRVL